MAMLTPFIKHIFPLFQQFFQELVYHTGIKMLQIHVNVEQRAKHFWSLQVQNL